MKRKVLITGASGFLGDRCASELAQLGFEVVGIYHTRPGSADIEWEQADLMEPGTSKALMQKHQPTHLLHLAWCTKYPDYWQSLDNYAWVRTSAELLTYFGKFGGIHATCAGTCAEYAESENPLSEKSFISPKTAYGASKAATFMISQALAKQFEFSLAWPRLFYIYGPGEDHRRFIPQLIRELISGKKIFSCQSPDKIIDLIHVFDAAKALSCIVDLAKTGPINIGSGQGIALMDVCKVVERLLGYDRCLKFAEISHDRSKIVAEILLQSSELGWVPSISIEDGLANTIKWWDK